MFLSHLSSHKSAAFVCAECKASSGSLPLEARVRADGVVSAGADDGTECSYSTQVCARYSPWLYGEEKPPNPTKGETLDVGAIAKRVRTQQYVGDEVEAAENEDGRFIDEAAGCACYNATHDGTTHMTRVTREETNMNSGGHPGAPDRGEFVGLFELFDGISGPVSELKKILNKLHSIRSRQTIFGVPRKHQTYLYDYPVWGKQI